MLKTNTTIPRKNYERKKCLITRGQPTRCHINP